MITTKKFILLMVCTVALVPGADLQAATEGCSRTITNKQLYIGAAIIAGAITAAIVTRMLWKSRGFKWCFPLTSGASAEPLVSGVSATPHASAGGTAAVTAAMGPDAAPLISPNPMLRVKSITPDTDPIAHLAEMINVSGDGPIDYEHFEKELQVLVQALSAGAISHLASGTKKDVVGRVHVALVKTNGDNVLWFALRSFEEYKNQCIKLAGWDGQRAIGLLKTYSDKIEIPRSA